MGMTSFGLGPSPWQSKQGIVAKWGSLSRFRSKACCLGLATMLAPLHRGSVDSATLNRNIHRTGDTDAIISRNHILITALVALTIPTPSRGAGNPSLSLCLRSQALDQRFVPVLSPSDSLTGGGIPTNRCDRKFFLTKFPELSGAFVDYTLDGESTKWFSI
jgi:hypothetical protein